MYQIAAFSRLQDVPIKTLHYYDAIGLLPPARTDPATGYRYYGAEQSERLNQILVDKDLGFSLRQVRSLLQDNLPPAQLRAVVHAKREELQRGAEDALARLARADARLSLMAESASRLVVVREAGPFLVASLRQRISCHEDSEPLLAELSARLGRARPRGCRGAIWHQCGAGVIECEVFELLALPTVLVDGLRVFELPRHRFASLIYRGDTDYLPAFAAVRAWMSLTGAASTGPKREIYLDEGGADHPSVTEGAGRHACRQSSRHTGVRRAVLGGPDPRGRPAPVWR